MSDDHAETEANYFAMCLLMPREFLVNDLATMFPDGVDPTDDEALAILAKRYQVSKHLMAIRLTQLEMGR